MEEDEAYEPVLTKGFSNIGQEEESKNRLNLKDILDQLGDLRVGISNEARELCIFKYDKMSMAADTRIDEGGQSLKTIIMMGEDEGIPPQIIRGGHNLKPFKMEDETIMSYRENRGEIHTQTANAVIGI